MQNAINVDINPLRKRDSQNYQLEGKRRYGTKIFTRNEKPSKKLASLLLLTK